MAVGTPRLRSSSGICSKVMVLTQRATALKKCLRCMTTTTTEEGISPQRKKPRKVLHEATNARNPKSILSIKRDHVEVMLVERQHKRLFERNLI
jgi:hypothetical protein